MPLYKCLRLVTAQISSLDQLYADIWQLCLLDMLIYFSFANICRVIERSVSCCRSGVLWDFSLAPGGWVITSTPRVWLLTLDTSGFFNWLFLFDSWLFLRLLDSEMLQLHSLINLGFPTGDLSLDTDWIFFAYSSPSHTPSHLHLLQASFLWLDLRLELLKCLREVLSKLMEQCKQFRWLELLWVKSKLLNQCFWAFRQWCKLCLCILDLAVNLCFKPCKFTDEQLLIIDAVL